MNLSYPFKLISGKGLGLSYSSYTQIGAALPSRDLGLLKIQSFVNVNTGNLILFDYKLELVVGVSENMVTTLSRASTLFARSSGQPDVFRLNRAFYRFLESGETLESAGKSIISSAMPEFVVGNQLLSEASI